NDVDGLRILRDVHLERAVEKDLGPFLEEKSVLLEGDAVILDLPGVVQGPPLATHNLPDTLKVFDVLFVFCFTLSGLLLTVFPLPLPGLDLLPPCLPPGLGLLPPGLLLLGLRLCSQLLLEGSELLRLGLGQPLERQYYAPAPFLYGELSRPRSLLV